MNSNHLYKRQGHTLVCECGHSPGEPRSECTRPGARAAVIARLRSRPVITDRPAAVARAWAEHRTGQKTG